MESRLQILKTKLHSLGALSPEAWEAIVAAMSHCQLKPNQYFTHQGNALGYVAQGILTAYDMEERSVPAIVHFTCQEQSFMVRQPNPGIYLKAYVHTLIFHWDCEALKQLYKEFNELKHMYHACTAAYEQGLFLRMRLLELPVTERITKFRDKFHHILPYLKKKDIANYLHLNYSHFVKIWNILA